MPVQRWPVSLVTDQGRELHTAWSGDQTVRVGPKFAGFSDPGAVKSFRFCNFRILGQVKVFPCGPEFCFSVIQDLTFQVLVRFRN